MEAEVEYVDAIVVRGIVGPDVHYVSSSHPQQVRVDHLEKYPNHIQPILAETSADDEAAGPDSDTEEE